MNHKNKHLRVSYFSHSFMVGQALHIYTNLNSSRNNCFNCLGNYAYIKELKNVQDKGGLHVFQTYFWSISLASLGH